MIYCPTRFHQRAFFAVTSFFNFIYRPCNNLPDPTRLVATHGSYAGAKSLALVYRNQTTSVSGSSAATPGQRDDDRASRGVCRGGRRWAANFIGYEASKKKAGKLPIPVRSIRRADRIRDYS